VEVQTWGTDLARAASGPKSALTLTHMPPTAETARLAATFSLGRKGKDLASDIIKGQLTMQFEE